MTQLKNFITIPKYLKEDYYSEGLINKTDIIVILWINFETNPVNGYANISYSALNEDLSISEVNLRKILTKLKRIELIWFQNRKGKRGSFKVWARDFIRSDKSINNLSRIKERILNDNYTNNNKEEIDFKELETLFEKDKSQDGNNFTDKITSYNSAQNGIKKGREALVQKFSFTDTHTNT